MVQTFSGRSMGARALEAQQEYVRQEREKREQIEFERQNALINPPPKKLSAETSRMLKRGVGS